MERYIAIDNVCAWPIIKKLPRNEIGAFIFNQPCHLLWEGTVELWISGNGGKAWERRGAPVINEPGTSIGHVAAGLDKNGVITTLCGGLDNAAPAPGRYYQGNIGDDRIKYRMKDKKRLSVVSSVSADNGGSWTAREIKIENSDIRSWTPFGSIISFDDGALGCSMYTAPDAAAFFKSRDGGKTWEFVSLIASGGNETDMIRLPDGRILAAVRKSYLDLYESNDDGESWKHVSFLTAHGMYPAGFTLLNDGHLLLSYGIRHRGFYGIGAMTMHLESGKWNTPMVIADMHDAWDGGYPSNVQLDSGEIVTAYYCGPSSAHGRYHMGVIIWSWPEMFGMNTAVPKEKTKN